MKFQDMLGADISANIFDISSINARLAALRGEASLRSQQASQHSDVSYSDVNLLVAQAEEAWRQRLQRLDITDIEALERLWDDLRRDAGVFHGAWSAHGAWREGSPYAPWAPYIREATDALYSAAVAARTKMTRPRLAGLLASAGL